MIGIVRSSFQPTIYIIDDKSEGLKNIENIIKQHGFISIYETNPQVAMKYLSTHNPSIVLISEKITGVTGIEMCYYTRTLMNLKESVVIMAREPENMAPEILLEKNGPDAYIVTDKGDADIVSKVKYHYMMRRSPNSAKELRFGDIEMNLSSFTIRRQDKVVRLGPTEFKILQCFLENPKSTLSREQIMSYVWGQFDSIEPRTIDVHINRLRSALKVKKDELPIIETIRSVGYCIRRNFAETA